MSSRPVLNQSINQFPIARWMQKPKSIFDNVAYGPRLQGVKNRSQLQQIIEDSLNAEALRDEVKDDHATNIAEDVIYMIEGQIIRHKTEQY